MHFTYRDQPMTADLMQGDVIQRTPEVEALLQVVHPHYFHRKDNRYFIVLTQDCDLVRRGGKPCDARYITIAPVREISVVLSRHLQQFIEDGFTPDSPVCTDQSQNRLRNFLERLLNNNEANYFFLRREPSRSFPEDCCAFLALSIAVKAAFHYDALHRAKILELQDSFRAKLGWLVGQMYARIGTEDWPSPSLQSEINQILSSLSIWIDKRKLKDLRELASDWKGKNPGRELDKATLAELARKIPKRKEKVVAQAIDVLASKGVIAANDRTRVANLIRNDSVISSLIAD
jgi:hypothetical protein